MPLYEYQCDACGARLERIQRYADPPLQTCPTCGGSLTKLLSSPAIQFKGSGWYITDYARKPEAAGGKDGAERKDGKTDGAAAQSADSDSGSGKKADAASGDTSTTSTTPVKNQTKA